MQRFMTRQPKKNARQWAAPNAMMLIAVAAVGGLNLIQPRLSSIVRVLDYNYNWTATANSTYITGLESQSDKQNQEDTALYCSSPEGSLHQVALDMFYHSSPPGSPSYQKLRHVLDGNANRHFFIDLGAQIFDPIQESITSMLVGYGLTRLLERPTRTNDTSTISTITLVETETQSSNSLCPIHTDACRDWFRIYIQSEQQLGPHLGICHGSPNCIVLEFSEYNYRIVQGKGWADSFVLLPVMTQQPSRLNAFLPKTLTPLRNRSLDMVFFGVFTERRQILPTQSEAYLQHYSTTRHARQNDIVLVKPYKLRRMAKAYANAKVCLITHSYSEVSGGEYHRLSEFAPFGCIPVAEQFADVLGIERYEKCGRVVFAPSLDSVMETAATVIQKIEQDESNGDYKYYQDFAHVQWWNKGIQWETIFTTVFNRTNASTTTK